MNKKILIVLFLIAVVVNFPGATPLPSPPPTPTPSLPCCDLVTFSLEPAVSNVKINSEFQLNLNCNFNSFKVAAYGFNIHYDPKMLMPGNHDGEDVVVAAECGDLPVFNAEEPGVIRITGFDVNGFDIYARIFLKLNFTSLDLEGTTEVSLEIDNLSDINANTITLVSSVDPAQIKINNSFCSEMIGDVNIDQEVDIVDALLVAQSYVSLCPSCYLESQCAADVNQDGLVDIVDALIICQYYIGYISELPAGYKK